jgi:hypothetical protein
MTEETTSNNFAEPLIRAKVAGEVEKTIADLKLNITLTPDITLVFHKITETIKGKH